MAKRDQTINYLNQKLKTKAQARGLTALPEQATVNMAEVAKVKIKNAKTITTNRPQ